MAQSKAEAARRVNYHYMADVMRRLEWDLHQKIMTEGRVPDDWHEIARTRGESRKVRVTLTMEADVLKFFRSLGEGYGPRMNRVLAGFMHARLAGLLLPAPPQRQAQMSKMMLRRRVITSRRITS